MISKQIINFFKTKPVRLFIFFIVIAGIMTGISFAIMALVRAMGPKCPKGQTTIEGQDGCFNESCVNKKCLVEGIGIDYSNGPECPCNTKCPEGFAIFNKTKCEATCGGHTKTNEDDVCVYKFPLKSNDNNIIYSDEGFASNATLSRYECDPEKYGYGPDGKTPIICDKTSQCNQITISGKKTPYCNIPAVTDCSSPKKLGCVHPQGSCTVGDCNEIPNNKSKAGYCEVSAKANENLGSCCEETKLTLNTSGHINCCDTGTPVDISIGRNSTNYHDGCCPPNIPITNSGECCLKGEELTNNNEVCCKSEDVQTDADTGEKWCCNSKIGSLVDVYIKGGSTKKVCGITNIKTNPNSQIEGITGSSSQACYDNYKSKNGDLKDYVGIFNYNGKCKFACGFYENDVKEKLYYSLDTSTDKNTETCNTDVKCIFGNTPTPQGSSLQNDDGNVILADSNNKLYWKPQNPEDTEAYSVTVSGPITNKDECNVAEAESNCFNQYNNLFSSIEAGFSSGNTKIKSDFSCSATNTGANIKVKLCALSTTTDVSKYTPWKNVVLPQKDSSGNCGSVAPQWNGTDWIKQSSFKYQTHIANDCKQAANNCKYLDTGEYCEYGSFDGKICLLESQKTSNSCSAYTPSISTQKLSSKVSCTQPNRANQLTAPKYVCTDNNISTIGYNICCGNGIISQDGNYNCTCTGPFGQDANNPSGACYKGGSMSLLEMCTSFNTNRQDTSQYYTNGNKLNVLSKSFTPKPTDGRFNPTTTLLILSIPITSTSGTTKSTSTYYLNSMQISDDSTYYLGLTDKNANLGIFLYIADKPNWATVQNSIASNSAAAICGLNTTNNTYFRALNNIGTTQQINAGNAIFDLDEQNYSTTTMKKSIIPVPVEYVSNKWVVILVAVHISYDSRSVYIDDDQGAGRIFFGSIDTSNNTIVFTSSVVLNEGDNLVLNNDPNVGKSGYVTIPNNTALFNVDIAYNITDAIATPPTGYNIPDIIGKMKINDIITAFQNNNIQSPG